MSALSERAIAAKGGRERLHALESVSISGTSGGTQDETLGVLPSKLWDWNDERPTIIGPWLHVADLERGWSQFVRGRNDDPLSQGEPTDATVEQIRLIQVLTFMETRRVRPNLDGTRTIRPVFRRVQVIDAHLRAVSPRAGIESPALDRCGPSDRCMFARSIGDVVGYM